MFRSFLDLARPPLVDLVIAASFTLALLLLWRLAPVLGLAIGIALLAAWFLLGARRRDVMHRLAVQAWRGGLVVLALGVGLAACATGGPVGQTPAQRLFAMEGAAAIAIQAAGDYAKLPRCGSAAATAVCSDPAVVSKLAVAGDLVESALLGAEAVIGDKTASAANVQTAIDDAASALSALTRTVPPPKAP